MDLGRPLGYLIFSLIAFIGDPVHKHFSKGFRGQPRGSRVHNKIKRRSVWHLCAQIIIASGDETVYESLSILAFPRDH